LTWSNGGDFYNSDYTASVFDSPENVETLTFLNDLVNKYKVSPTPAVATQAGMDPRGMFNAGQIAIKLDGPWAVGQTGEASIDKGYVWDVAPFPPNKRGDQYRKTRLTWDGIVLGANSKGDVQKAAFEFIKWTCVEDGQQIIAQIGRVLPSSKSAALSDLWAKPATEWHEEAFVEAMKYARLQPVTLMWPKFNEELGKQHSLLLTGGQTPEQTVKNSHRIINQLAQENQQLLQKLQAEAKR
jgi:multiple sugar transport system substrate-binding protein